MKIRLIPTNLGRMVGNLEVLATQISIRNKTSTKKIAQQILLDSLTTPPFVPADTTALRSTGRVEPTTQGHSVVYGGASSVRTKKGDYNVDYANLVHDDLRPRHYKVPGSGPKFIETHVNRRAAEAGQSIIDDMQVAAAALFGR